MPSRISGAVVVVLLGLVGASTSGCGRRQALGAPPSGGAGSTASAAGTSGGAGSTASAAGTSGGAGSADSGDASGLAGTTDPTGVAGTSGVGGGAGGMFGVAGATGEAGAPAVGGSSGAAGAALGPLDGDVSKIVATPGCGQPAGQPLGMLGRYTIVTMGNKPQTCADSVCGPWSYTREYFLRLPTDYDATKPYPITFEGPGCGGKGNNLLSVPGIASTAIRVGLSPSAEAAVFHATNPGQGCFDDHDGDDSVDWVFYERLYDKLAAEVCFDRNRVFASGNGGGAVMANELACKYAGDALRPVRGVLASAGALPVDPKYRPTCTSKPMAGIWAAQVNDVSYPFNQTTSTLARAMAVNGCTIGNSFQTATFDPFVIMVGAPTSACEMVKGCPAAFPLVICPLPGTGHSGNDAVANPAWASFLDLFPPTP